MTAGFQVRLITKDRARVDTLRRAVLVKVGGAMVVFMVSITVVLSLRSAPSTFMAAFVAAVLLVASFVFGLMVKWLLRKSRSSAEQLRRDYWLLPIQLTTAMCAICMIQAVTVPQSLRSYRSGNEAAAIRMLCAIVDDELLLQASEFKQNGYRFTRTGDDRTYTVIAVPTDPGRSGVRGFLLDKSGVIRFTEDGSAPTAASPPIR